MTREELVAEAVKGNSVAIPARQLLVYLEIGRKVSIDQIYETQQMIYALYPPPNKIVKIFNIGD